MMAGGHEPITEFPQWYTDYEVDSRTGALQFRGTAKCADHLWSMWTEFQREMDARVENYWKLEKLADGEVLVEKPDLPNVSSGESAGIVRRVARNLVQNCPNVEVISKFDDDDALGLFAKHTLLSKIIGSDSYSNDMQQNLFASAKTSFALGFAAVIPVLLEDPAKGWYVKYDAIHYRDVFPEPGAKDIRDANIVFVRRYLTKADVIGLLQNNAIGWDPLALKRLLQTNPSNRQHQSTSHQDKKHGQIPRGYEIITCYTNTGEAFLTFDARDKMLLRIEKNKHPLKQHPVHFLVLEKDDQQPLGKSQIELLIGRQDFQDLMLNGAMKLWYRNINPSIIGYGAPNAVPNLSPGKYTQISNPNAKIEAFEVNTQTLMQYPSIAQNNLGSMVNLVGSNDQQMAAQAGNGMSATPQGVEAQQTMVDITTNNYQKAIESFFSHYCSYALTVYFQELKAVKSVKVTAEARIRMEKAGYNVENIDRQGQIIDVPFEELATEYWVRCVPGSLTELEDEKQMRILNQMFIPLSQAMPAMGATQDMAMMKNAARAMQYIIQKQIELSGAADAKSVVKLWQGDDMDEVATRDQKIQAVEDNLNGVVEQYEQELETYASVIQQLQTDNQQIKQNMQLLLEKLGVMESGSNNGSPSTDSSAVPTGQDAPSVLPASA